MAPYKIVITYVPDGRPVGYWLSFSNADGTPTKIPLNNLNVLREEEVLAMLRRLKASEESIATVQEAMTAGRRFRIPDISVDTDDFGRY
jgi:hypothetical protein